MYHKDARICMQSSQIDVMNEQFLKRCNTKYEYFKETYGGLANFTLTYTRILKKYQTDKETNKL